MVCGEGKDNQFAIVNLADKTIVADVIAPLATAISGEAFALLVRVVTANKVFSIQTLIICWNEVWRALFSYSA